ncbi:hypothetical protein D3C81_1315330 [compost metagenome]
MRVPRRQACIETPQQQPYDPVENKHRAHRIQRGQQGLLGQPCRYPRSQCSHCGGECTDQPVAGEQRRPDVGRCRFRQPCVFQRQKDTDVAGARVQRADEGDHQKRPQRGEACKAQASRKHEYGRQHQQATLWVAVPDDADDDRGQGGADQGCAADEPDCHRIEPERQQVGRQQHGNIAIADATQRAAGKQWQGVTMNAGWQRDAR